MFTQVFEDIPPLQSVLDRIRSSGKTIGFVPTMGALHEGHISLIEQSQSQSDYTIASIFVNPTQFNDSGDLANYPRQFDEDFAILESVKCDAVFTPSSSAIYPEGIGNTLGITFGSLEVILEGAHRPGHFKGVGQVLSKLFNIVRPDFSFFGQKDLQQCMIVEKLVRDMHFPTKIIRCPIIRDSTGLAKSSRNARLSKEGLREASTLNRAITETARIYKNSNDLETALKKGIDIISQNEGITLEYLEALDLEEKKVITTSSKHELGICIAAFIEGVRLIDNIIV